MADESAVFGPLKMGRSLTTADALLCLRNSDRLYRDSKRVSPESRLALVELAIEEAAKGNIVLYRLNLYGKGLLLPGDPGSRLSQQQQWEGLDSRIRENSRMFNDAVLEGAFHDHKIKLRFVEFLLGVSDLIPAESFAARRVTKGLGLKHRFSMLLARWPRVARLAMEEVRGMRERLSKVGVVDLDTIGKRATFVGLGRDPERCIPPKADPALTRDLILVYKLLRSSLEMLERRIADKASV